MNNPLTSKDIENAFDKLPEQTKRFLVSTEVDNILQEIGKVHGLHVDQVAALSGVIMVTFVGLRPAKELQNDLQRSLFVDDTKANTITNDINEKVFKPFTELLKKERETEELPKESSDDSELENDLKIDITRRKLQGIADTPAPEEIVNQQTPQSTTSIPESQQNDVTTIQQNVADKHYPDGIDPYREPTR